MYNITNTQGIGNWMMFDDIVIVKIDFKAIYEDDCDIEINLIIIVLNL